MNRGRESVSHRGQPVNLLAANSDTPKHEDRCRVAGYSSQIVCRARRCAGRAEWLGTGSEMSDDNGPPISAHIPYVLAWMLANPGPQRRKDIQEGGLEIAPWTEAERAIPPTAKEAGAYPSLLHQRVFYAVWRMRDDDGFIENTSYGMYVLTDLGRRAAERLRAEAGPRRVGRPFPTDRTPSRRQNAPTTVFAYDPDARDRATHAHEVLVHQIRDAIVAAGLQPLIPRDGEPQFDVAFYAQDVTTLVVIEVKSLSGEQAVHQLRLGLGHGQVLHYTHLLSNGRPVRAALAVPVDPPEEWEGVCAAAGVTLVLDGELDAAIARLA